MPKMVDHHERRTQIAEALLRIAADRGLEAASLRHVAAEAGATSGMVQHYFRSRDEMMAFALDVVSERVQARVATAIDNLGDAPAPEALVRALLVQLLPLDEPRRLEGRVLLAYFAHAAVKPTVAAALGKVASQLREHLADQIRSAQNAGTASARIDPPYASAALLALVDGLGIQILGENFPPDAALAVLDTYLATIFGHAPG